MTFSQSVSGRLTFSPDGVMQNALGVDGRQDFWYNFSHMTAPFFSLPTVIISTSMKVVFLFRVPFFNLLRLFDIYRKLFLSSRPYRIFDVVVVVVVVVAVFFFVFAKSSRTLHAWPFRGPRTSPASWRSLQRMTGALRGGAGCTLNIHIGDFLKGTRFKTFRRPVLCCIDSDFVIEGSFRSIFQDLRNYFYHSKIANFQDFCIEKVSEISST